MPKGQKIVDWTKSENDQKLLLAIIKVSEGSKKYHEIAAAFGKSSSVPSSKREARPRSLQMPSRMATRVTG